VAKNVVNRIDRNLALRLREARREIGLSTRAVASKLPKRLAVSHTTIASYENGTTVPPVDVLGALATTYGRTLNWFLENRRGLDAFRYRNLKPRVRLHDKRQFEALAGKWVDAYANLENHLKVSLRREIHGFDNGDADPKQLAAAVRSALGLGESQAIQNVVTLLEACAVRVMELRTDLELDAVAARHDDNYVVILNPETSNDRLRMNVGYEIAHILYGGYKKDRGWSDDRVERCAYDFASELLLPDSQLERAFDGQSFLRLIEFKERFGISLAAMIHRAEKSGIIRSTTARRLWTDMVQKGWRKNEPGYVWRDRAIRFETLMDSALHTGLLTWEKAEDVTGIREDELRKRIAEATEYGSVPRREETGGTDCVRILKLTVEE
jgi:Zn-dependent peptidase ImmA (M78 family)/transcriptional regulator with XRE-family HTH domain